MFGEIATYFSAGSKKFIDKKLLARASVSWDQPQSGWYISGPASGESGTRFSQGSSRGSLCQAAVGQQETDWSWAAPATRHQLSHHCASERPGIMQDLQGINILSPGQPGKLPYRLCMLSQPLGG